MKIQAWVAQSLRDPGAQWSAGTYGAIAEFSREPAEPAEVRLDAVRRPGVDSPWEFASELGKEVRAVAYETTTKNHDQWGHAIALCLTAEDAPWVAQRRSMNWSDLLRGDPARGLVI